ncbi:MAG TPA: hypothetical protein VHF69_13475 [Candidatus Synoicihabitans sp.]|nr:hypothetical protein [Candidatus Synoicihabitans sp.]
MRLFLLRPLLVLVVLVSLIGCASNAKVRNIAVQLVAVKATSTSNGGAQLALSIRYFNENLVPIATSGGRHRLTLGDVTLPRIESEEPIGLPQLGSDTQDVTVTVDAGTVARLRALQSAGTVSYQLDSTLLIEAGDDDLESRTGASGSVSLAELGL